jgi:hypothetical protein
MVQFHPKPHHGWRTLHESFETLLTVQDLKKRRKKDLTNIRCMYGAQADCTSVHTMKLAHAKV